jgi:hypothetical protein
MSGIIIALVCRPNGMAGHTLKPVARVVALC